MSDSTLDARRRNLLVTSVVIIVFTLGGGKFEQVFSIKLTNEWVAILVFYILFLGAYWRFRNGVRNKTDQFIRAWLAELSSYIRAREILGSWVISASKQTYERVGIPGPRSGKSNPNDVPPGCYATDEKGNWREFAKLPEDFHAQFNDGPINLLADGSLNVWFSHANLFLVPEDGIGQIQSNTMIQIPPEFSTQEDRKEFANLVRKAKRSRGFNADEFFDFELPRIVAAFAVGTTLGSLGYWLFLQL